MDWKVAMKSCSYPCSFWTAKGNFPDIIISFTPEIKKVKELPQLTWIVSCSATNELRNGSGLASVSLKPSCPIEFVPQKYTWWVYVSRAAWLSPTDTCSILSTSSASSSSWALLQAAVAVNSTFVGNGTDSIFFATLWPRMPSLVAPQEYSSSDACAVDAFKAAKLEFAEQHTLETVMFCLLAELTRFCTMIGYLDAFLSILERPNCPNELSPIAKRKPASLTISVCEAPHATDSILLI